MNPRLLDSVRLKCDLPSHGLAAGTLGAILNIHIEQHVCFGGIMSSASYVICPACGRRSNHTGYDVEFRGSDGTLACVVRLGPSEVEHVPEPRSSPDPGRLQRLLEQGLHHPKTLHGAGAFVGNLLAICQSLDELRTARSIMARVPVSVGSYAAGYKDALADVVAAFEDTLTRSV